GRLTGVRRFRMRGRAGSRTGRVHRGWGSRIQGCHRHLRDPAWHRDSRERRVDHALVPESGRCTVRSWGFVLRTDLRPEEDSSLRTDGLERTPTDRWSGELLVELRQHGDGVARLSASDVVLASALSVLGTLWLPYALRNVWV